MKKIRLAFIGIRGIPVIYSGFESFAELLGEELSRKGFDVWAYNRLPYCDKNKKKHKEINLINLWTIRSKNFETLIHSFFSTLHAIFFLKPNIIYYFGVGNAVFTFIPRFFGIKTVINVDGLDWKRKKWGKIASLYLRISQYLATILPNITITDSLYMKDYYLRHYEKKTIYIPYGFDERLLTLGKDIENNLLKEYKIKKNRYFVWVGRIVPDNHLDELIYAFKKLKTDYKCVVVGEDVYNSEYKKLIYSLTKNDRRFIFTGFVKRDVYAILVRNAFCYVETKRSGGTHPSLIEAMGLTKFIVSNDYLANKQLLKKHGFYYKANSKHVGLLKAIIFSLKLGKKFDVSKIRLNAINFIKKEGLFLDKILNKYIHLFNCTV